MATIAISTAAQKSEFLARLNRIENGTGSSKSTLYVGLDETVLANSKANERLKKQAAAIPAKPLGLFAAILSLVFGAGVVGLVSYLQFSITGEAVSLAASDVRMGIHGGVALTIAMFCGFMVKMPLLKYTPIAAFGAVLGLAGFHNLVHVYPAQFANMFSPIWVEQVVTTTEANSIIWRGVTYVL